MSDAPPPADMPMPSIDASSLASVLGGELRGSSVAIHRPATLVDADANAIAPLAEKRYIAAGLASQAGCLLVAADLVEPLQAAADQANHTLPPLLIVSDVSAAWADVLARFAPPPVLPPVGIDPAAVVDPRAILGEGCRIGPAAVIGAATLGDRVTVAAGAVIEDGVSIGQDSEIGPRVVIRTRCKLGARCRLEPGVVIGADGFGYRFADGHHHKVPHIGIVEIGDDCEIGANTTIDRAKTGATRLGNGCKIDNLCQIAHNCVLGNHVVFAAQVGLAGSVIVEDYVVLGGAVGVKDHVRIARGTQAGGKTGVVQNTKPGDAILGQPAVPVKDYFRQQAALAKLPEALKTIRELTRRLTNLEQAAHDERADD